MEIHFKTHAHSDEISPKVTALAQRKLIALKKYLREGNTISHVYVELGKDSEAHHKGDIWRAQINLDRAGKRYHAEAHAEKIEAAVNATITELETELQKAKDQRQNVIKKGGVAVKALLRGYKLR